MDRKKRILMEELLKVRSPVLGICALLVPILTFLWVISTETGFSVWINLIVGLFTAFLMFMAMNEILAISNHHKTLKILKLNEPSRTTLEALIIDPNLTGLTSNQTRAIKNHLKRHM
ncbi:hypothetical protein K6L10_07150 [Vibrio parahaemolyticus]|uniref:hypothetical protein n=1 Tax=Vibrio parahaemolyticus TaxID=670 RepID=UPI001C92EEF8|nr:hypothetical protein [Vibrio parahaemolyticus]MBY4651949.1 hypothetical protein [Vibrio parahaemolyticus]